MCYLEYVKTPARLFSHHFPVSTKSSLFVCDVAAIATDVVARLALDVTQNKSKIKKKKPLKWKQQLFTVYEYKQNSLFFMSCKSKSEKTLRLIIKR